MDINLHIALEKLKTGDIKSAMDQLRYMSNEIVLLNTQVTNLYTELQKKVNLTSEKLNGAVAITKLGSGTVSTSAAIITGTNTLFQTDCSVGNIIKIGVETASIISISSNTSLTTNIAFSTMTNQLYAIIKNATQELLTGEFQYGELNGDPYNGVITQGSTLQQYGRMNAPNDVVNVQFVQRSVYPAMARALNAIQRDGDTVGLATVANISDRYDYLFRNVNMTIGDSVSGNSDLKYYGVNSNANNVATMADLADLLTTTGNTRFFAHWLATSVSARQGLLCGFAGTPLQQSSNFYDYFELTANGLTAKRNCNVLVIVSAQAGKNIGADILICEMAIKKNNIDMAYISSGYDGAGGGIGAPVGNSLQAALSLVIGDSIAAGPGTDQGVFRLNFTVVSI